MDLNILPKELADWKEKIRDRAKQVGLDFFDVVYEMVDYREINELASLGGFPQRYPHWRFGMEYDRLSKSYAYGMSKIYEMVINTDPCYAYLLSSNSLIEHKLVMAHVYGHSDFFKNNVYFSHTNRRMLDQMANHSSRIRTKHPTRESLASGSGETGRSVAVQQSPLPHPSLIHASSSAAATRQEVVRSSKVEHRRSSHVTSFDVSQ
jgi:hypothetical protein